MSDNPRSRFETATDVLLARILRGESTALDRLFRRSGTRLVGLITVKATERLRRWMEPEDILQEVYVEAWKKLPCFEHRGPGSFYAWLAAVAVSKIRELDNHLAAAKRDPCREVPLAAVGEALGGDPGPPPASDDCASPSDRLALWEAIEGLRAALAKLPDHYREIVKLRYLTGVTAQETADALRLTRQQVYAMLPRALRKLRAFMR